MDNYRAFLAIAISFAILLGYQYFFVGFEQPAPQPETQQTAAAPNTAAPQATPAPVVAAPAVVPAPVYDRPAKDIKVTTDLFTATISEDGGTLKSFVLNSYRQTHDADSGGMQLVTSSETTGFPLEFGWGGLVAGRLLYESQQAELNLTGKSEAASLKLVADAGHGLTVERTFTFHPGSYLVDLQVVVKNGSDSLLQGAPQLNMVSAPFNDVDTPASGFLFFGPAVHFSEQLLEIKADEYETGPKTLQGSFDWIGYEGNYFLFSIIPGEPSPATFTAQGNQELTRMQLAGELEAIASGQSKQYQYKLFIGPKKIDLLKEVGHNLDRAINYGWFDVIAKPTLWLLNFLYKFLHNYGLAIILVTVIFKVLFWPITQKGMKSMKNMQKLQPKMVKIKEKYKNDPAKMNQEVMNLYKTYKVNPLGGCLPMLLQIPVFFALYKVLLQSIELRHAPFMLWISDLSAPDRLWIGFDIPYLGGLPVLTLLMGASMFLQQKMTPTSADPTQQKIMLMLPIIFTFMFINFSSGLVLYWFVNNLLSILQQVMINRETKTPAAA